MEYTKTVASNSEEAKELENIEKIDPLLYPDLETREYLERQAELYEQQKPELLKKYANMYIIFEDGKVVDFDESEEALVLRAYAVTEPQYLFVQKVVVQEPILTVRIPFKFD